MKTKDNGTAKGPLQLSAAALGTRIRAIGRSLQALAHVSEDMTVLVRYTRLPKEDILVAARISAGRSFKTTREVMAGWRESIVCHGPAAVKNTILLILQLREVLGLLDDDRLP